MKFSFIIPVYNGEEYLESCIKNIMNISIADYEIIIVDDGSTDATGLICSRIVNTYPRIRYIYQENQGPSVARNSGLREAKGEFVLFIDVDDSFDTIKLSEISKVIESNKKVDLIIYGMTFDYFYNKNCYRRDKHYYPQQGYIDNWANKIDKLYDVNVLTPIWNKIFRRDILIQNRLFFNSEMFVYEDLEFSIRYLTYCDVIYNTSECIYHYRQAEDEGNSSRRLMRIEHLTYIINQIEFAFNKLFELRNMANQTQLARGILLDLYCIIAREKITISNIRGINIICNEFKEWFESKNMIIARKNKKMIYQLLKRRTYYFVLIRFYIKYRHKLAVWIKNRKWYQSLRFNGGDII